MHFFLYQIAARAVAIYLLFDCIRTVRNALLQGNITCYSHDVVIWLLGPSSWVVRRDAAPIQYWMLMGFQVMASLGFLFIAIFGWHPNA